MRGRPLPSALIALLAWAPAAAARACPNCYGATDGRVLDTYYLSTLMLSLLPFAIVGVIALVARHAARPSPR